MEHQIRQNKPHVIATGTVQMIWIPIWMIQILVQTSLFKTEIASFEPEIESFELEFKSLRIWIFKLKFELFQLQSHVAYFGRFGIPY